MKLTRKNFLLLTLSYFGLRIFSFVFPPDTPLHGASMINNLAAVLFLSITAYLLIKKNSYGWYLVIGEIILGGAGNFFAFFGISLRTALLMLSLSIFFTQQLCRFSLTDFKVFFSRNRWLLGTTVLLLAIAVTGATRGLLAGHTPGLVFADTIPYFLLLYYFPLANLRQNEQQALPFSQFCVTALFAAVLGNCLFMLFTEAIFSAGIFKLQNSYYHWFRDVANGKITELPFHFYRVVLNEQLLLAPLIVIAFYRFTLIRLKRFALTPEFIFLVALLAILAMNLTRVYMLAIAGAVCLLWRPGVWKRWLISGAIAVACFITIFSGLHFAASRGESLGAELFGLRLQSITQPKIEESSLSRLLLLPKIIEKIKLNPLLGSGLGDSVTVYSPVLKQTIITPHFDWGFLEILAELGLLGSLSWLLFLLFLGINFARKHFSPSWQAASLVSLMIITLTSPGLFHTLGILWLAFLLVESQKEHKQISV